MKVDSDIAPLLMGLSLTAIILRLDTQSCNYATSAIGNSAIGKSAIGNSAMGNSAIGNNAIGNSAI